MKKYLALVFLLGTISSSASEIEVLQLSSPESAKNCSTLAARVLGKPEKLAIRLAEKEKLAHRVVQRDGTYFMTTKDYLDNRLNFVVRKNIVSKAYCG